MSERVRRYPSRKERRAFARSNADSSRKAKPHTDAGQRSTSKISKEGSVGLELVGTGPLLNESSRLWPERHLSFLSALSVQSCYLAVHVTNTQTGYLGYAGASVVHQGKKHSVPSAAPRLVVASGKDGGHFLAGHEADDRLGAALERNCEQALAFGEVVRSSQCQDKVYEATDCCQSGVSCANDIVAGGLKMIEKSQERVGV